jgi:hypothetical protein
MNKLFVKLRTMLLLVFPFLLLGLILFIIYFTLLDSVHLCDDNLKPIADLKLGIFEESINAKRGLVSYEEYSKAYNN